MASTYTLTIDGNTKTIDLPSLELGLVANGRDYMRVVVTAADGSYRPALGDEVILDEDGTDIFGGVIAKTVETGVEGLPIGHIATEITVDAFNVWADKRFVTETFAASSTLKSILTTLVTNYLADFGVTLDASQATGPTFTDELVIDGEQLSSVLQKLTELAEDYGTGESWLWEIDPAKVFRMVEAGSVAAPVNFVDGDGHQKNDLVVTRSRDKYANRVVVKFGPTGNVGITDSFTGDGTTDTFTLSYPIAAGAVHPYSWAGYVTNASTNETLDVSGQGATWEYDPSNHTIQRVSGAPANAAAISINYDATFPQIVTAQDATEITNNGLQELILVYPNVTDKAVAQALADAALVKLLATVTEVRLETYEAGIAPGQSATITAASRNVNSTFLITEVRARSDAIGLKRTVIAVQGDVFRGSFRDVYRAWLGGGSGGTVTSTVAPVVGTGFGGTASPANPNRAVQFNDSGAFGGTTDLLVDKNNSGDTYGVEGLGARLAVGVPDDSTSLQLAIFNESAGKDAALTFWQIADGSVFIELDSTGGGISVLTYNDAPISLVSSKNLALEAGLGGAVRVNHRVGLDSIYASGRRTVATAHTMDSGLGLGDHADCLVLAVPSTSGSVTLPALSSTGASVNSSIHQRFFWVVNGTTAFNEVVHVGSTADQIGNAGTGTTSLTLPPGEGVHLGAWTGTSPRWLVLGRTTG